MGSYEYKRQADTYPKKEWTWRGIVDPSVLGGDPGTGGLVIPTAASTNVAGTIINIDFDASIEGVLDKNDFNITGTPLTIVSVVAAAHIVSLEVTPAALTGQTLAVGYIENSNANVISFTDYPVINTVP